MHPNWPSVATCIWHVLTTPCTGVDTALVATAATTRSHRGRSARRAATAGTCDTEEPLRTGHHGAAAGFSSAGSHGNLGASFSKQRFAVWMVHIGIPAFVSIASSEPCRKELCGLIQIPLPSSSKACMRSQRLNYPILFSGK